MIYFVSLVCVLLIVYNVCGILVGVVLHLKHRESLPWPFVFVAMVVWPWLLVDMLRGRL